MIVRMPTTDVLESLPVIFDFDMLLGNWANRLLVNTWYQFQFTCWQKIADCKLFTRTIMLYVFYVHVSLASLYDLKIKLIQTCPGRMMKSHT